MKVRYCRAADRGRQPEVTGNLPECQFLYKSGSKYFPTKNCNLYRKPVVLHISDVKMHADYVPGIRLFQKIIKPSQIGFFFLILCFITLKPEVFPITSGHRPRSRPPPRHNLEFFLSPAKEFTLIALLGSELTSPPFGCNENKNPSLKKSVRKFF